MIETIKNFCVGLSERIAGPVHMNWFDFICVGLFWFAFVLAAFWVAFRPNEWEKRRAEVAKEEKEYRRKHGRPSNPY